MKILVIGANGALGKAVSTHLDKDHEVMRASRKGIDVACDMTSQESIQMMFEKIGEIDAIAITAGKVYYDDFTKMDFDKYHLGIHEKLLGQVNIVLLGSKHLSKEGSFTLISGILAHDPIPKGSSASMVNSAVEGFVRGVAIELPYQQRINVVSPTLVEEAVKQYGEYFKGFDPIPAHKVALAYEKSIMGKQTGQIYSVIY